MISGILVVSFALLVFGIVLLLSGTRYNGTLNEVVIFFGAICVVVSIAFGFGLGACLSPVGDPIIEYLKPFEIARSGSTIFVRVEGENKTLETKEHKYFLVKDSDIKIKKVTCFNSYGLEVMQGSSIGFFIDGEKDEKELEKQEGK